MQGTCIYNGCIEPSAPDADECGHHLAKWEREQAAKGETEAPCINGHFGCAHLEGGACHGDPSCPPRCPNRLCVWKDC